MGLNVGRWEAFCLEWIQVHYTHRGLNPEHELNSESNNSVRYSVTNMISILNRLRILVRDKASEENWIANNVCACVCVHVCTCVCVDVYVCVCVWDWIVKVARWLEECIERGTNDCKAPHRARCVYVLWEVVWATLPSSTDGDLK